MASCVDGIAVPQAMLVGMTLRFNYVLDNPVSIPILPLAISSILLTILIYCISLMWIAIPLLAVLSDTYAESGRRLIENHIFTIISGIFTIVLIAISLMFRIISG